MPDVAAILHVPYHKVYKWISDYWDQRLNTNLGLSYSWSDGKSKAIDFHTLVELVVYYAMHSAGVKPKQILNAHDELSSLHNTDHPFAHKKVLDGLRTDGKAVFFDSGEEIISLDGKKQFQLAFIQHFLASLEFDAEDLASKFWPMGKSEPIVVDPKHQFGQPVIKGTNIRPETLWRQFQAGETEAFIASIYALDQATVASAIRFCEVQAA